jgi:hypothetical protein
MSADGLTAIRETRTARIGLDDGVVIVRIRDGMAQTLADATDNLSAAVAATGEVRRPLLIDIRTALPLEAEVRHHYSGRKLVDAFAALALLVEATPLGRMIGNVYLRIARPGIPTQLFVDEPGALAWLAGHRS